MPSNDKKSERTTLLSQAEQYVSKDRNNAYGSPTQDFTRIAAMWTVLFNREFTAHEVAMAMICLKLSRLSWASGNYDSWVDVAGYSACGWECAVEESKQQ